MGYCDRNTCNIAYSGLKFPNGLVRGRGGLIYVPSTIDGTINVFTLTENHLLQKVNDVKVPLPIDNLSIDKKGDVGSSGLTHLARHLTIDGVADDHIAEVGTVLSRPKIKRLERKLIEAVFEGDHASVFARTHTGLQTVCHRRLTEFRSPIGIGEQRSVGSRKGEEITPTGSPEIVTLILDGVRILGGHQGFEAGEIGQKRSFAVEHAIALIGQVGKRSEGVVQVRLETLSDFLLNGYADDEQAGNGKSQRNRQERYHQSCPHPPLFHESVISFHDAGWFYTCGTNLYPIP